MIEPVVDHSTKFCQARDQGRRPTCLAFAVSDGHAYHRQSPQDPLSCEYLYYKAAERQRPDHHYAGVRTGAVVQALGEDGQPLEAHYPYQLALDSNTALPVPPDPFPHPRHCAGWAYETFSEPLIIHLLEQGHSIVLALMITKKFQEIKSGQSVLTGGLDNDPTTGIHAVVGVGYGKNHDGDSYIKIRNSWGQLWGKEGYIWIPMTYVANQLVWMARFSGNTK